MPRQIANVHDAFFKQVLADPELAGQFLREQLPPEVADLLGPESPEPLPASFVDEQLREHHSDLLFRVHLKAGSEAFAYLLLEHKSSPDEGARLQLLRYVVRVLTNWYEQGPVAVSHETIRQVLHRRMSDREEQIMGWLTQPYFEQGIEKGIEKGIQQGRVEGHAKSLVRLLERRFGGLPAHVRKRVFAADMQSLDTWFDRAIDAADLQSVFAEPLAVHG
jgi:predicted transposase YdaD